MEVEFYPVDRRSPRAARLALAAAVRCALATTIAVALASPAWAACSNNAPVSGETVTCDTSAPNPQAVGVIGGTGVDGVTVKILAGANMDLPYGYRYVPVSGSGNGWRVENAGYLLNRSIGPGGGVELKGSDSVLVNSGRIEAFTTAVVLGERGQLVNSGNIGGSIGGNPAAAVYLGPGSSVINTGAINNAGRGPALWFDGDGSVDNRVGGWIGRIEGAGDLVVDNRGTIDSGVTAFAGDTVIVNHAGGVIESQKEYVDVVMFYGDHNDRVINAGRIASRAVAIDLGGGDDLLVLQTGTELEGPVKGGDGNDVLRFEGVQTLAAGSSFQDFETVQAAADANWSMAAPISSAGAIAFDIGDRARLDLAGAVAAAALSKNGAGLLRLGGANAIAGTVAVAAGTLQVDGTLDGSVTVSAPAMLSGSGRIGALDNAGTVAPAGSGLGTLTVGGNFVNRAEGVVQADISAAGDADLLRVLGNASLQGGRVDVVKAPGQYAGGTRYTLLQADGAVSGQFAQLTQNSPFLLMRLAYDANRVYLDIARSDLNYAQICEGFNECQAGAAVDRIAAGGVVGADLGAALNELSRQDVAGARMALGELGGDVHSGFASVLAEGAAQQSATVSRRLLERRTADSERQRGGGAWAQAFGGSGRFDRSNALAAADFDYRGVAVGADAWIGGGWLLGAGLDGGRTQADFAVGDRGKADGVGATVYAAYSGDRVYLDAVVGYQRWDNDIDRAVRVGAIQRVAHARYDGRGYNASFEAGYDIEAGGSLLQPLLSVRYERLEQDAFRESGAGDLDLIGARDRLERGSAGAGLRWSHRYEGQRWVLDPSVQAQWLRGFGDRWAELDTALAGAPAVGLRTRGVAVPDDRGSLAIGLRARTGQNLELALAYEMQRGDGFRQQGGSLGLRWAW